MTVAAPAPLRVAMGIDSSDPLKGLGVYARQRCGIDATVSGVRRLSGGASCDTWAFDLQEASGSTAHALVLRRAFNGGLLTTNLQREFALLSELHAIGLPVAQPQWFEPGGSVLGAPFIVTERVNGTDLRKALAVHGSAMDRFGLGAALARLQARVHAVDWRRHLAGVLDEIGPEPKSPVDGWAQVFENEPERASSAVLAAIEWLRANLPEDGEQCLLHGDFKANNILFAGTGKFSVLDWEMAHVGDPLEDLAWTMLWTTKWDIVGGLMSPVEYVKAYMQASGREAVDETRLQYWRVFAWMKLAAIFHQGGQYPERPVLTMLARAQPYVDMQLMRELRTARRTGSTT